MGLEEQFKRLFPHQTEEYLDYEESLQCTIIAENFAIGFVQWCLKEENNIYFETKELLEIYKKTL
jgi:hypothetical protein